MQNNSPPRVGAQTDKGPVRGGNEDAFWIPNETIDVTLGELYLAADGVGGQQAGEIASYLATQVISEQFYHLRQTGEPIAVALEKAIRVANLAIMEDAQRRGVRRMGSTLVAAVQEGTLLTIAHVGDARAYLVHNNRLIRLTRDDSWVQEQVDAGLLTAEEAARHELRNVVTQVLGNKLEIKVHIRSDIPFEAGDIVLLCSDGLYDVVPDKQLFSLLTEYEPQQAADQLIMAAIAAEASDNITAVVIANGGFIMRFSDEPTVIVSPVAPAPSTSPAPATLPDQKKSKVSTWLIVLAAIAILIMIASVMGFWLRNRSAAGVNGEVEPTLAVPTVEEVLPTSEISPPADDADTLQSAPTAIPSSTDAPVPKATATLDVSIAPPEITENYYAIVANTDNLGANIRVNPGTNNDLAGEAIPEGTHVLVISGPEEANDLRWWKVQQENGVEGWVAAEFLGPSTPP